MTALRDQVMALLHEQQADWPLLRRNLQALDAVPTRTFRFALGQGTEVQVRAQGNPARLASCTAASDEAAVRARACVLCAENRPGEQRGVAFGERFLILCNPYPIFRDHLTVISVRHEAQAIAPCLDACLALAEAIGDRFVIFYNGPRCGASVPEHLHFQAGEKGALPLEADFERMRDAMGDCLVTRDGLTVHTLAACGRPVLALESQQVERLRAALATTLEILETVHPNEGEPMVNLLVTRAGEGLRVLALPRTRHRPACFDDPDPERRMVLSPGSVDLGGLLIVPRPTDFERLTAAHIEQVYRETTLGAAAFARWCEAVSSRV